ncbi:MAG: M6 family metalloprotease domain-containing protein [Prevotella sp.]|nr:M6 family metalloprotease domain-containing protein [Prevotella sp.]
MKKIWLLGIFALLGTANLLADNLVKSNLVCFVRFADETDDDVFDNFNFSHYQTLFNGTESGANTVYNYFKQASYGKLDWTSVFYPAPNDTKIMSYQAQYARGFYQRKSSINPDGYDEDDATAMAARERALVKEIISHLNENVAPETVIDADNDGIVDNLTIVLSGSSEISARNLLWPKRSDLVSATNEFSINGKKVVGYILTFDKSNGFNLEKPLLLNTGVLCHEMSHALGTYDLYHVADNLNPVGIWDLMSDNQTVAQNMTVYTKWRYCKWLEEEYGTDGIPEISAPGTYTLNPVGSATPENIAYKIKPIGSNEYFVVEYRKKEGFDSSLPESGLIIYRINPNFSGGNIGYNGTTRLDEQYIFRPGGTLTADGQILKAAFSAENGRTAFGGEAEQKPFYSDGSTANFAIANITSAGETISFDLLESPKQLIVSENEITLNGQENSSASVIISCDDAWSITGTSEWLLVSPESGAARATAQVSISAKTDNTTGTERQAVLTVSSTADATLSKTIIVRQEQKTSGVLLFDNFENTANPLGWEIENSGEEGKGWQYTEGTPDGKAKKMVNSGTHAMTMTEAFWGGEHQVAKLTSPSFANGKTLSFYSHTNGGNATPREKPYYLVEVSSDGGATWHSLFNVLGDYPRDENGNTITAGAGYVKITLDLSEYLSADMKIRFHCYDTDNDGLNYWWQIDDVEIMADDSSGIQTLDGSRARSESPIYTLDGRKTSKKQPLKGVYVTQGKKILVQ